MAPIRHGSSVIRSSAFQVRLSKALARSAGARSALIIWLRAWWSACKLRPLNGTWMPIPAPT
jgi:hypothetical protein